MNIGRLAQDELAYEMKVRGLKVGTVEEMRKALRSSRLLVKRNSMEVSLVYPFSYEEDVEAIEAKIEEIRVLLKVPPRNPKSSEYIKIVTKIEWCIGRLARTPCEAEDEEDEVSSLRNKVLCLLGDLTGDSENSDREEEVEKEKTPLKIQTQLRVQVGQTPCSGRSALGLAGGSLTEPRGGDSNPSANDISVRVPIGNRVDRGDTSVEQMVVQQKCTERLGKWGVKFTGDSGGASINSFLERVEELRLANDVPESHLFKSASELLAGRALMWFRSVREDLGDWQELVKELKAEFLPANYDDLLLEEINRRSQGKEETFGAYLTTMRTLFRRLSEPLSEGRMLSILKKNVDPFYQVQIASAKPETVKELAILGRELDTLKVNVDSFTPPSKSKNLLEPECGYQPSSSGQHRVAAVAPVSENPLRQSVRCHNCNREGHIASRCTVQKRCFGCGAVGVTRSPSALGRSSADDQQVGVHLSFTLAANGRDTRPYLGVRVYGIKFLGLLDSGASRTIVGGDGWKIFKQLGLTLGKSSVGSVALADGTGVGVAGSVSLPVEVENKSFLIECLVIPNLPHQLILGADFWALSGIVPDLRSGVWNFSNQERLASMTDMVAIREKSDLNDFENRKLELVLEELFKSMTEGLGCTNLVEHKIRTSAEPIKQRYYPVSPAIQKHIDQELQEMLEAGVIEKSKSPWASPILLVKKKDGSYRFCVDYRKLNEVTDRDAYPLPFISAILDKLRNAKYLSSLDIKSAYWQIPMEKESRKYTAFTVPGRGLYQFCRMPFGLHNSPATWQRFIDDVLGPDLEPFVFVYLDDIIIVTDSFDRHLEILKEVFKRLGDAGLKVGREKCNFCRPSLKFLGYVVDRNGLHVDPEKVESMIRIPAPKNVKEIRSFVGTISWYRRFVPNFAILVRPLTDLLKKSKKFEWTKECEESFRKAKECLVTAPILTCPDFSRPFVVQTDASDYGIGAVLSQEFEDGEKAICYLSRSLNRNERNYSTTEKECLAVLWAIEKLRPYLEGVRFTVVTDHHSLVWLSNLKDPQGRLARWAIRLQQFDFKIIHRKGKEHVVPDMLSRGVPEVAGVSEADSDPWVIKMKSQVEKSPLEYPSWRVENGRLYKHVRLNHIVVHNSGEEWKLVLGKSDRTRTLNECHDAPLSGHMGVKKTFARVAEKYYWPKMRSDITRYVRSCKICQSVKPVNEKPAGLMTERVGNSQPWEMICVDLVGPLPKSSRGFVYILTVVDYFTKFPLGLRRIIIRKRIRRNG
ncbi:uncharacterized protein LOC129946788 [Eupeodes corollae]|uniref:uncharacterized protein LOC129946788 n=1 Tax=Eupeodes corollae TaxID=290404 RepID=UPI002491B72B|nr:uncharacterized protein LOC129946788 [Eupeodes corollae]